jgi:hypothetical protein
MGLNMKKFIKEYGAPISALLSGLNLLCFAITGNIYFLITAWGLGTVWFFYG